MIKRLMIASSALLGMVLLAGSGCSKDNGGIDTSRVEAAFQHTDSTTQSNQHTNIDNALAEIRSRNYSGALASLQKAGATLKLTPEQKSAIDDLMNQIQVKASEALKTASKSAGDVINNAANGASQKLDQLQQKLKK